MDVDAGCSGVQALKKIPPISNPKPQTLNPEIPKPGTPSISSASGGATGADAAIPSPAIGFMDFCLLCVCVCFFILAVRSF